MIKQDDEKVLTSKFMMRMLMITRNAMKMRYETTSWYTMWEYIPGLSSSPRNRLANSNSPIIITEVFISAYPTLENSYCNTKEGKGIFLKIKLKLNFYSNIGFKCHTFTGS